MGSSSRRSTSRREVEAVREAVDMIVLLTELAADPRRQGSGWRARCPVHGGEHRNLSFDPITKVWCCFSRSCHEETTGDVFGLVMGAFGCDFSAAVEFLSMRFGNQSDCEMPPLRRPCLEEKNWARSEAAWDLLRELWELTFPLEPTEALRAWSERRGWSVETAWRLGLRDWRPVLPEVIALLRDAPAAAEEAGLVTSEDGPCKIRFPLRHITGATANDPFPEILSQGLPHELDGVAVPLWREGRDWPDGYRWRTYRPNQHRDYPPKSIWLSDGGQYVGLAPATSGLGFASVGQGGRPLLLVEGEPDWIAVSEVVEGSADVVGLVSAGSKLLTSSNVPTRAAVRLLEEMSSRPQVVILLHDVHGRERASEVVRFLAETWPKTSLDERVRIHLLEEGRDAADLHKDRELGSFLRRICPDLVVEGGVAS